MSFVVFNPGSYTTPFPIYNTQSSTTVAKVLDALDEKAALIGEVYWSGRPASKTVSSAGGKIAIRLDGITWSAGSSLIVGIQDVLTTSGPPPQPDEVFDVSATISGGSGLTGSAWNVISMTTGSKTIAHGDLVAIVLHLSAFTTGDIIRWGTFSVLRPQRPVYNEKVGSPPTWATTFQDHLPMAYIVADDGTLGAVFATWAPVMFRAVNETFNSGSNPNHRGLAFTPQNTIKVDRIVGEFGGASATADYTLQLVQDPTGAATVLQSVTVLGEQTNPAVQRPAQFLIPETTLTAGTEYGIVVRPDTTTSFTYGIFTSNDANLRALWGEGSYRKITRNGGTGSYTADSPALTYPILSVGVSAIDIPSGGGGLLVHPGMRGGFV